METKPLLYGIVGFIMGGLLVSIIATTGDNKDANARQTVSTSEHSEIAADKLRNLKGDNFDKAFMDEMITHHESAIEMAKLIETNAKHDELKDLGQAIISAQSQEIDMMQSWQGDWGYKSVPKSHDTHGM